MSALSGVPVADLQWLVQSGVEAFLNMPPSALFPVPAEVSAQTFLNASRNFLWRLGFATISKSDARMLLNTARLWAKVNSAKFAALPVVEPVWSAEMEEAEMAVLDAEVAAEEAKEAAAAAVAAGKLICPECKRVFTYKGALTAHIAEAHGAPYKEAKEIASQSADATIKYLEEHPPAMAKHLPNSAALAKARIASIIRDDDEALMTKPL